MLCLLLGTSLYGNINSVSIRSFSSFDFLNVSGLHFSSEVHCNSLVSSSEYKK